MEQHFWLQISPPPRGADMHVLRWLADRQGACHADKERVGVQQVGHPAETDGHPFTGAMPLDAAMQENDKMSKIESSNQVSSRISQHCKADRALSRPGHTPADIS